MERARKGGEKPRHWIAGKRERETANANKVAGRGVAQDLFNRGLCLPSGSAITNADLARIISIIRRCHK